MLTRSSINRLDFHGEVHFLTWYGKSLTPLSILLSSTFVVRTYIDMYVCVIILLGHQCKC